MPLASADETEEVELAGDGGAELLAGGAWSRAGTDEEDGVPFGRTGA